MHIFKKIFGSNRQKNEKRFYAICEQTRSEFFQRFTSTPSKYPRALVAITKGLIIC